MILQMVLINDDKMLTDSASRTAGFYCRLPLLAAGRFVIQYLIFYNHPVVKTMMYVAISHLSHVTLSMFVLIQRWMQEIYTKQNIYSLMWDLYEVTRCIAFKKSSSIFVEECILFHCCGGPLNTMKT